MENERRNAVISAGSLGTVLVGRVLHAVGSICFIGDQAVCQRSGRVLDLGLHVVSALPGQRTSVHCELCGGFSENSWRTDVLLFIFTCVRYMSLWLFLLYSCVNIVYIYIQVLHF